MKLLHSLRSRIAALFHRSRLSAEIDEELASHILHRADDLERSGLDRAQAERQARIEFGGQERVGEECHRAMGSALLETLLRDVRFSLRVLRKSPGFTVIAVLTLALAIGANAVVFGVMNALILRPLDVPQAESLYEVEHGRDDASSQSYPNYVDLRDRNRSFDGLAAYSINGVGLDTGGEASRAWAILSSGNYFDALRIQPYLGRFFHASDEHGPNSAPYVVLSYNYWHTHFQDDRGVLGRVIQLNKHPFTIIGVAPPAFHGALLFFSPDVFVPMVNQEQLDEGSYLNARGKRWVFDVMGHLKPGVTPAQAVADLNAIGADLEKKYPETAGQLSFRLARPGLYGDFLGRPVRGFVAALMLLACLILLAACANLGSLFAARAADRSREVALRLALGASRNRVLRQLLTEAVLISLVGGAIGLWGSIGLLRALNVWQPLPRFPVHIPVTPDVSVYAVALVLAVASGILFGLVPFRQVQRADPYQIIKAGSNAIIGRRISGRELLLGAQIAICAVLVTASMVAVRGLVRSLHSDFGFDPQNVMLVDTDLTESGYSGDRVPEMQKRMVDAAAAIPGVTSAALVDWPPLTQDWQPTFVFDDKTTDLRPANAAAMSETFKISPEYFHAAGTTLLSGRALTWHDDKSAPRVAVVNQEFARKMFGSVAGAMGAYYKLRDGSRVQVVGIVENGKYQSLTESQRLAMFIPFLQSTRSQTWLVVRSNRDADIASAIRNTLHALDPGMPLFVRAWSQELDGALFPSRVATLSLGVLGVLGAMLSISGIFGMAAYSVSKRMRELGIRMALGAQRKEVLQAALGRAVKLLAFGSAAGLLLGILASRVLSYIVYQASPRDPLVLGGVVLAMSLLGLLATWIPAQRALSIDPLILLRED